MKIMTFNIRHGGGTRVDRILDSVFKHDPDTVVFTEYRENGNGLLLRNTLAEKGYITFASSSIEAKKNAVAIASRSPCVISTFPIELKTHSHRAIMARFENLSILGVYFAQNQEKKILFDFINSRCQELFGKNGLIIGDFNTGKHYLDESKKTFHCAREFEQLETGFLIDSWRSRNPDAKEYSWYSNAGNGFRIDHVFSTPELDNKLSSVLYSHDERESGISDHSALIADYS